MERGNNNQGNEIILNGKKDQQTNKRRYELINGENTRKGKRNEEHEIKVLPRLPLFTGGKEGQR